jgi:HEAT repeat protein
MTELSPFTRSFAHLVWLLAHHPDREGIRATLLDEMRERIGSAGATESIVLTDITFAMAGAFQSGTLGQDTVWLSELSVRMAAHSVRALEIERGVTLDDVARLAAALAAPPATGDEGEAFDRVVLRIGSPYLVAHIGNQGFVRRATPVLTSRVGPTGGPPAGESSDRHGASGNEVAGPVARDGLIVTPPGAAATSPPESVPDEIARIVRTEPGATASRVGSLGDLVARLRGTTGDPVDVDTIRGVVRETEDRGRRGLWVDVAVVLDRLHRNLESLPDGDVRRAHLSAIRRLETPTHMRGLVSLLPRRRELRATLTAILARAGEAGADALLGALVSSDVTVERRAYRTALAHCPEAVPALVHLLGDGRWYVVRNAVELLGELAPPDADVRIAQTLLHGEPRVRRAAVTALARLGTQRAVLALLQTVHDPSPEVRLQAALALGTTRSQRAVPWILEALDKEDDGEVQGALLSALGKLPTDDAVARLIRVAESSGRFVRKRTPLRVHAVQALAEADTPAAQEALRRLQGDRSGTVRAAAVRAARQKGPATEL